MHWHIKSHEKLKRRALYLENSTPKPLHANLTTELLLMCSSSSTLIESSCNTFITQLLLDSINRYTLAAIHSKQGHYIRGHSKIGPDQLSTSTHSIISPIIICHFQDLVYKFFCISRDTLTSSMCLNGLEICILQQRCGISLSLVFHTLKLKLYFQRKIGTVPTGTAFPKIQKL